jgi:hypothetical protein
MLGAPAAARHECACLRDDCSTLLDSILDYLSWQLTFVEDTGALPCANM